MSSNNVVLEGTMKKLKTMKKKYFVLFGDTATEKAHLRYYDSEKKFKQAMNKRDPVNTKRSIVLKDCFNINRKMDTRYPNVLALYTKDECFAILFEQETDLHTWLIAMLRLSRDSGDDPPKPLFDHIWEATIQKRGLGESKNLWGPYRICINARNLTLIRLGYNNWTGNSNDPQYETIEISIASIRRYGASQCLFYLEVGRVSKTGDGEIWMETADSLIAQNMHDTIAKVSKENKYEDSMPSHRGRSQSVNDTSKSTFLNKNLQNVKTNYNTVTNIETPTENVSSRERCDSLPSYNAVNVLNNSTAAKASTNPMNRPNSLYTRSPTSSSPLSPISLSRSDDDSSFSVDEVDGMNDDLNRSAAKNTSSSHLKMAILEENSEDFSISDKEISEVVDQSLKIHEVPSERGYLVMLPVTEAKKSETRSRTSSFVDEVGQRGFDNLSSSASSITSGTPSTDTRFSAFHLEKIPSYFSCEEADSLHEQQTRPARTYSVGSRPEFTSLLHQRSGEKGPLENLRSSRTRAFSLGSKARHYPSLVNTTLAERDESSKRSRSKTASEKSTSQPSLSKGSLEVVNNLMEIDFSNNTPTQSSISSSKQTNPLQSPRSPAASDYMEMVPNTWKSESSATMTSQLELEKNAKNSLKLSESEMSNSAKKTAAEPNYLEMSCGSFDSSRIVSEPIAITAKKAAYQSDARDDYTSNERKNSIESSQQMIFSLSLENIKIDDNPELMEVSENAKTPPTEPLVSPLTPPITTTAAKPDYGSTTPQIFQPAPTSTQTQITTDTTPTPAPGSVGDYTFIAPPQYNSNIQRNYVELDFPVQSTNSTTFRKEHNNTPKPLYAQLMFPSVTTAPAAIASAANATKNSTTTTTTTTSSTTINNNNNSNNKKKKSK